MLGIIPCQYCNAKATAPLHTLPEFVPEYVKQDRKKHLAAQIPPFRGGVLSKEYLDLYGTNSIKVTPEQVANAQPVWSDLPGIKDVRRTK